MDLISEALRQVRLSGAVLFRVNLAAPWSFLTSGDVRLPPPASHVTVFHVVLDGECWACAGDAPLQHLHSGDAVIIPRAEAHRLSDEPGRKPVSIASVIGETPLSQLHDLHWGSNGPRTRILCGFLGYERAAFAPLYDALPPLFCVHLAEGGTGPSLAPLLCYAENEVVARLPGSTGLRLRMTELLFVESLRRYMADLPADESGWLAAVRDPIVGRAMALLHAAPERQWTVTALAQAAESSRSTLSERFGILLGEPPMHYLARWRMLLAALRLRDSRDSIEAIAEAVGYGSPAAFQRAFKNQFGMAPGTWRRCEKKTDC